MTIWDTLTGRRQSQSQSSQEAITPATSTQEPVRQHAIDPASVQDISSFLGDKGAIDVVALHPGAGLNSDSLEYLSLEDSQLSDLPGGQSGLPSRGWSDDLCYGTGITYLGALGIGGTWGLAEGLRRSPPTAPPKLKLNSVLNAVTRRGPFLGNSAGVLAMGYNGLNSTIGYYRGKHDPANSIVAGAMSGMLFRSTKGLRPMVTSGAMVASAAAAWTIMKKALFDG
ncbi:MAG: Mitochondrial import inner membrane translocase subunit tim23 [Alyxoria varia]|nr:MAG: Mitochondrial import inner membrane translocase subunit tim23 [Alyxoria varia]